MILFEIAEKTGISVTNLSSEVIRLFKISGLITRKQEKDSLAELKKADQIWENSVPGAGLATSLW